MMAGKCVDDKYFVTYIPFTCASRFNNIIMTDVSRYNANENSKCVSYNAHE